MRIYPELWRHAHGLARQEALSRKLYRSRLFPRFARASAGRHSRRAAVAAFAAITEPRAVRRRNGWLKPGEMVRVLDIAPAPISSRVAATVSLSAAWIWPICTPGS